MNDLNLVNQWCASLRTDNYSKKTLTAYRRTATVFLAWCETNNLDYQQLDHRDIGRWLDTLPIGPRSRYAYTSNLGAFYAWLIREEHLDRDPTVRVRRPRLNRLLPRPAPLDVVLQALDGPDSRTVLMIALGAFAGLRVSEIAGLRVADLHMDRDDPLVRIFGKGAKERFVPLHDEILLALTRYQPPHTGWLFPSLGGRPISVSHTGKLIVVALDGVTPHQLRHLFATGAYAVSGDIRVVQELLGHQSVATTQIYTQFSPVIAAQTVRGLPSRKLRAVPDEAA